MAEVALADIARRVIGRAGERTELPVYSVTKHRGFVPSLEYFKKQVFSRDIADYKVVEPGDFAYATIHLDEGSIGIAPERALISPMYTVFSADDSRVDRDYLIRFLKSPRALNHYPQLGKGAVHRRKAISLEALGSLHVPLPPLTEQRRIAAILDDADAIRAKRRTLLVHLDALTQALFHSMFGGTAYPDVMAGELMPEMRNGLSPATAGEHPAQVLTLSAVTQGPFDQTAVKAGIFAVVPPPDKRVSRHDFLMCRGNGNKSLVGVGTFSPDDLPAIVFPDTVIAGRVDTTRVEIAYLDAAWRQPRVRDQIESGARTTNGTYKVNQQTLAAITVPIPPLDAQQIFTARAARIHAERVRVLHALIQDNELFASLQSRAFNGGL